jgi:hypothetical protein
MIAPLDELETETAGRDVPPVRAVRLAQQVGAWARERRQGGAGGERREPSLPWRDEEGL